MGRDDWLNLRVVGCATWPREETTVVFCGCEILLKPATRETEQSAHVNLAKCHKDDAYTALYRFLSVLSWCDGVPMEVPDGVGFSGSSVPMPISRQRDSTGSCAFTPYPFYRELETDKEKLLALALYREARTVNSIPYAFLGYYKILNIWLSDKYKDGKRELLEYIKAAIPTFTDSITVRCVSELRNDVSDIPEYLYKSCRNAVAHANVKPTADPDDWIDVKRFAVGLEVIRGVAEKLMVDKGISRSIVS